jgi:murein L,D-transpeptidase YafK
MHGRKSSCRWKIMTIYSKEMKTTRRCVEEAMKENREECMLRREDFKGRIGERGARNWEEETRWRKQRGRDWWNGLKKMDGRY